MFRALQIDPDTLAIHINVEAFGKGKEAHPYLAMLDDIYEHGFIESFLKIPDSADKLQLIDFGASYLHELRHFGDLLLTPYGFYRLRTAFEFFVNAPALIATTDDIPIPIMSAMDPVTRSILDISPKFEDSICHQLGRTMLTRVRLINEESGYDESAKSSIIGGERILEALGYLAQFEFLFQQFPYDVVRNHHSAFFAPFTGTIFDHAYRWFMPAVHDLHPNEEMPNNYLITAILFASLCGVRPKAKPLRTKGPLPKDFRSIDVSDMMPSHRYYVLLEHFKKTPCPSLDSPYDAYRIVDKACTVLFGMSIIDAIAKDIEICEEEVDGLMNFGPRVGATKMRLAATLQELHEYRKVIFKDFVKHPIDFTCSQFFYENAADKLKPSIIFNMPSGVRPDDPFLPNVSRLRTKWLSITFRTLCPPSGLTSVLGERDIVWYSGWAPLSKENGFEYSPDYDWLKIQDGDLDITEERIWARHFIYQNLAPLYRYVLYGNKHRAMLEVDTEELPSRLGIEPDRLIFDPWYVCSDDIALSDSMFRVFGHKAIHCDVCGRAVKQEDSFVVSPRTMRQNQIVLDHFRSLGPEMYYLSMERDWSNWLICAEDMNAFGFPKPSRSV